MVSGSGKKPWRQKGTGRARVGEIRNPLWRKGGTVFGPQPRSYDYQLPKKVEKGALRAALAQKLHDGAVIVVDALSVGEIKTKAAAAMLKRLGVDGKALLVDVKPDDKLALSVRNIAGRAAAAEQPRDRARRDGHAAGRADARGAREAAGGAGVMKIDYDVIRRPLITEKTTVMREDGRTLVFQVAMRRQQDRHQARRRAAARTEGRERAHRDRARQVQAPGPLRGPALGLEEGLREAAGGREAARVPGGRVADEDR